jgi:hypothetical protein
MLKQRRLELTGADPVTNALDDVGGFATDNPK